MRIATRLFAAILVAAWFVSPSAGVAAVPPVSVTGLYLDGEPHEWLSSGDQWTFMAPDDEIVSTDASPDHNFVTIHAGPTFIVGIDAPPGQALTPGVTFQTHLGLPQPGEGVLSVAGDGRGCSQADGEVTVLEATWAGNGTLASFAANFRQMCDDGRFANLYGQVRWNSSVGIKGLEIDPDEHDFGDTTVGIPSDLLAITVTNTGTEVIQYGAAKIVGSGADEFEIVDDGCSVTFPGDSCVIQVRVNAITRGVHTAELMTDDSTDRRHHPVALTTTSYVATTTSLTITDPSPDDVAGPIIKATVSPNPGGGQVTFVYTDGSETNQAGGSLDPTSGTWEGPLGLPPGTWQITAHFAGFDYYAKSASSPVQRDSIVATTTTLGSEHSPVAPGSPAHLVAQTTAAWGFQLPAGTLTIRDAGDNVVASKPVSGDDRTLETDVCCLGVGFHAFTADYDPSGPGLPSDAAFSQEIRVPVGPTGSVTMNGGAAVTNEPYVALTLSATDPDGTVAGMRLSSDGAHWFSQGFLAEFGWSLSDSDFGGSGLTGTRTVYAQFSDNDGNWGPITTDTIILDFLPPTGTVAVEGGAAATNTRVITVGTAASDSLTGVSQVRLSNNGVTWTTRPYAPNQSWTLASGDGAKTVRVQWRDGAGNWSATKADQIVLDTTDPTTGPVETALVNGQAAGGKAPVKTAWTGADAMTGVARYELAMKTDDGAWATTSTSLSAASWSHAFTPGHRYRLRIRAVDNAGNVGLWSTSRLIDLVASPDASPAITYLGAWSIPSGTTLTDGTAHATAAAGATATFGFVGRSVGWLASVGPTSGKVAVYVDGVKVATVDLQRSVRASRQVVFSRSWSSLGTHTVELVSLGTAGNATATVDGFYVLRGPVIGAASTGR